MGEIVDLKRARAAQTPLNEPVRVKWFPRLAMPGGDGWHVLILNAAEAQKYNQNPDLWAARLFRFETAEEYREWVLTAPRGCKDWEWRARR